MIKRKDCDFEPQTIKAAKSGFFTDEISAHLKSCSSCRETAKVVRFFQTDLKKETLPQHQLRLPAAGFLWWKSKIIEKRRRAERVAQPILLAQIAAVAIVFVTFLWLIISKSSQTASLDAVLTSAFASVELFVVPFAAGIIGFALVCLLLVFTLRRYFSEK